MAVFGGIAAATFMALILYQLLKERQFILKI